MQYKQNVQNKQNMQNEQNIQNIHNMQNVQYSTTSYAPLVKDGVLYNLGGGTKSTTESLYLRIRQVCNIIEIIVFS